MLRTLETEYLIKSLAQYVKFPVDKQGRPKNVASLNVPNSLLVEAGLADRLRGAAQGLGVEFGDTGSTFRAVFTRENANSTEYQVDIYEPVVARFDGVPMVIWGEVRQPVSAIPTRAVFVKPEKAILLEVGEEGEDDTTQYYVMVSRDSQVEPKDLNKLKKEGNYLAIGTHLRKSFVFTKARDVAKNVKLRVFSTEYDQTYKRHSFEVEGHGMVNGNTSLEKQYQQIRDSIAAKPEYADYPLYITFGRDYTSRDGSKQCVEANLTLDIPAPKLDLARLMSLAATAASVEETDDDYSDE